MLGLEAATSSPVGSEVFAIVSLLVLSLATLLILRHYLPLRTTPLYLLVPVFFALWLTAAIVLLVPIDLATNASTDDESMNGIWLPDRALLVCWRISYWLTFVLTWFILPILAEYSDSGYRDPKDRIIHSLRENVQYYAICAVIGIVGLIYFFIRYGPSFDNFKALILSLSYCWGLIMAIYLMGHGLVSIPRTLFRNSSTSGHLRRLQSRAPRLYEKMEDSMVNLEELEVQVSELSKRKTGSARDYQEWIEELSDMCNIPESRPRSSLPRGDNDGRIVPTVITEKYLADLTRRLVRARHARARYVEEWDRLLHDASKSQKIMDSFASRKLDFGAAPPSSSFLEKMTILGPYTRYLLHCRIMPYFRLALGAALGLASICIIWSEVVKAMFPVLSILRFTVVYHVTEDGGRINFAGQIMAAFWIMYMCAAALTSVTEVKVWRGRALVRRNTAHESAFWYAGQVARLSVPLSYNFLTFLTRRVYGTTTFYKILGQYVDLSGPGEWFNYLFPVLILVPVAATLFGLYGKFKRLVGMDVDISDDDEENATGYGTLSWREGKDLIERELNGTSISARRFEDTAPRARAAPILSVPSARSEGATTPFSTSPSYHDLPTTRSRGPASRMAQQDQEPDEDNFFANLSHRFKNTIDTMDTPKWFQEIGEGIKKPKWMGGDEDDNNNNNNSRGGASGSSSSSRAGHNRDGSDLRNWFGGDGRIRL